MKISPGIKRKQYLETQNRAPDFEHVLPAALSAIRKNIDSSVEINEIYIALKSDGAVLSYDYKDLGD